MLMVRISDMVIKSRFTYSSSPVPFRMLVMYELGTLKLIYLLGFTTNAELSVVKGVLSSCQMLSLYPVSEKA